RAEEVRPRRRPPPLPVLEALSGRAPCWAVVPARFASTRLPGKVLADLGGRPMVWHVWARAREAGCFDRVLVATDDDRVVAALRPHGVDVARTAPAANGTARVASVAPPEVAVVNAQGDQPLVDP